MLLAAQWMLTWEDQVEPAYIISLENREDDPDPVRRFLGVCSVTGLMYWWLTDIPRSEETVLL
jgi:hypothetical protein